MARGVDLADDLGISYRQVYHWTQRGYIRPRPSGTVELDFVGNEERILRIMAGLVVFGLKPEKAALLAREHVESKRKTSMVDIDDVGFITIGG